MGTLDEIVNDIIPIFINIVFVVGVTILLSSIFIGIFMIIKKKNGKRSMLYGSFAGVVISLCALMINYMCHFEMLSETKVEIPISITIALIICAIFSIFKQNNK